METLKQDPEKLLEEVEGLPEQASALIEEASAHTNVRNAIKIPVKTGHEIHMVEIELGRSVTAVLDFVAGKHGCTVEELNLFRDGEKEPLATVVVIDEHYPHDRQHHVHFQGAVRVTVHYTTEKTHEFKRNATIGDVLEWAIKKFEIDPNLATEFDLTLHGTKEALPTEEHIGHLARRHDELALDLIRGDISNGSGS